MLVVFSCLLHCDVKKGQQRSSMLDFVSSTGKQTLAVVQACSGVSG
jgi:hypothetical protein